MKVGLTKNEQDYVMARLRFMMSKNQSALWYDREDQRIAHTIQAVTVTNGVKLYVDQLVDLRVSLNRLLDVSYRSVKSNNQHGSLPLQDFQAGEIILKQIRGIQRL